MDTMHRARCLAHIMRIKGIEATFPAQFAYENELALLKSADTKKLTRSVEGAMWGDARHMRSHASLWTVL